MNAQGGERHVTPPRATYRLQLSGEFPIRAASDLVSYLDRLGISHVSSSPVVRGLAHSTHRSDVVDLRTESECTPMWLGTGSTHRYDVVDPRVIDPDIGSEQDLRQLAATLHAQGMGIILDIAPNHMAATDDNSAWQDVLAHGPSSPFACWFDIDWDYPRSFGPARIVLPILGESRSRAIARGQLFLCYQEGRFWIRYFQSALPIDPATIPWILASEIHEGSERIDPEHADVKELAGVLATLRTLPSRTAPDPELRIARRRESEAALTRLRGLYERSTQIRGEVDRAVAAFAEDRCHGLLQRLLEKQCYRLIQWQQAGRQVNYRRFLDMNDLVGVRVEDPAVFEATHARMLAWITEGLIDGLTIDHIDGLLDPLSYLERLRSALPQAGEGSLPPDFHIYLERIVTAIEKILDGKGPLPASWPVDGTTGHDFLNDLEAAFVDPEGTAAIDTWYRRVTAPWRRWGRRRDFATLVVEAKRRFLEGELAADVERLTRKLGAIIQHDFRAADLSARDLRTAVVEATACLPVYRTYIDDRRTSVEGTERATIDSAIAAARRRDRARPEALELLCRVLLREEAARLPASEARDQLAFVQRFQQTSVPSMAKGLEEAARLGSIPLVSLNDVRGRLDRPISDAAAAFHAANRDRARRWPGAMICTTARETKHCSDVRARLGVLSEIPEIWTGYVKRWRRLNRRHRRWLSGRLAPDADSEYLLYQTLVGIWPLPERGRPPAAVPDARDLETLRERVTARVRTAARETKARTSWMDPNPAFEAALEDFVRALMDSGGQGESQDFLSDVARLVSRICRPGLWSALGRTLIHLTAPGVPHIYQGEELWNLSLVASDNRRPVDFEHRRALLGALEDAREGGGLPPSLIRELVDWPEDGRIKLWVISRALGLRRDDPCLFSLGDYAPLRIEGARARQLLAFTRRLDDRTALIVAPRFLARLVDSPERPPLGAEVWRDTSLRLPARLRGRPLRNVLTNSIHVSRGTWSTEFLRVADLLDTFPVALLVAG
jgi:(1->4)-alpha-D-glucan 1-alpha-D-glucosylmutase